MGNFLGCATIAFIERHFPYLKVGVYRESNSCTVVSMENQHTQVLKYILQRATQHNINISIEKC